MDESRRSLLKLLPAGVVSALVGDTKSALVGDTKSALNTIKGVSLKPSFHSGTEKCNSADQAESLMSSEEILSKWLQVSSKVPEIIIDYARADVETCFRSNMFDPDIESFKSISLSGKRTMQKQRLIQKKIDEIRRGCSAYSAANQAALNAVKNILDV